MKKAIVIIRTSTDRQEVESQRKVVTEFALKEYDSSNIIVIGQAGASAIKLDDTYLQNMKKVYHLIETEDIGCVYAFALDRIGRNDELLTRFKNYLITNKVQLKVMNPTLQLLNEDGTVNSGMELAFSLFITLSKQEMESKQARFKRAKQRNKEQGKFNGGPILPFGYSLDDNNSFIINEEEAELVRLVFNLYATGEYSNFSLAKELTLRGYRRPNSKGEPKPLNYSWIGKKLNAEYYCGRGNKPAIISEELFDKCTDIRTRQFSPTFSSARKTHLCNGLIYCPVCGNRYTYAAGTYRCIYRSIIRNQQCSNPTTISAIVIDRLVWEMTKFCYQEEAAANAPAITQQLQSEVEILQSKITNAISDRDRLESASERLKMLFVTGDFSQEEYFIQKTKLSSQMANIQSLILGYRSEIKAKEERLSLVNHPSSKANLDAFSDEEKRKLILKYFNRIEIRKNGKERHISIQYNIYGQSLSTNCWNFIYFPYITTPSKPNMFRLPTEYERNFKNMTEPIIIGHYGSLA